MDFLKKIKKKANETYKFTKEKTTKISEELKLKNKINENKDKIEELYIEIGKCVYREFKTGEKYDELNEKFEEIQALEEEINRIEDKILSIKNMKKCIKCNEEIPDDSYYCNKCGEKQPVEEKVEIKEDSVEDAKEADVIEIKNVEEDKK